MTKKFDARIQGERKTMSVREFRKLGFLQEVNRQILHPIGLALEVRLLEDGTEEFGRIWDSRDDPEGFAYVDGPDQEKAIPYLEHWVQHARARVKRFGWLIQPVGEKIEVKDEG